MGVPPPPSVERVVFRGNKKEGVADGVSPGSLPVELVVSGGGWCGGGLEKMKSL